jgi:hypothetical protein
MESWPDYPLPETRETTYGANSLPTNNLFLITSKVFESLLKRLLPLDEDNSLIPNHQFDFRQKHSTV